MIAETLSNPVDFIESLIRFKGKAVKLYPFQKKFLSETNLMIDRVAIQKGRAIGMSFCVACAIVYYSYCYSGATILIFSKTAKQAGYIGRYVREIYDSNPLLSQTIKQKNKTELYLTNGSRILTFTAGHKGFNVVGIHCEDKGFEVFDESAKIHPDEAIWNLYPAAANAGICHVSTPEAPRGAFYNACTSTSFKRYHFPSAISPRISKSEIEFWKENFSPRRYRTEVLGEFAEGAGNVFDFDSIMRNIDPSLPVWYDGRTYRGNGSKNYYYSLDPSRGNDKLVLTIGDYDSKTNTLRVEVAHPFRRDKYKNEDDKVTWYHNPDDVVDYIVSYKEDFQYYPANLQVDVTNDTYFAERLRTHYFWPVEDINWNQTSKERMINHLDAVLRADKIRLPDQEGLLSELRNFSYNEKETESGGMKKIYLDGEDDFVSSLCQLSLVVTSELNCKSFDWVEAW